MSTDLLAPQSGTTARAGGAPARRAVIRWAWRLFRHEWRQQLLVLTLLTVAVAATILAAAVGTNIAPPADTGFGTADHLVILNGTDPAVTADAAAIRQHFGAVDVIENQPLNTGLVQSAQLRAQDPGGRFGAPMLDLLGGRYPTAPDEVAMTRELASTYNLHVGDAWTDAGRVRQLVGLVDNPQNLLDNFALVPPGQLSGSVHATVLFDATDAGLAGYPLPGGAAAQTPQAPGGLDPAIVVLIFAIFGLIFVGLVAVAGFSVLAQRRTRALGMLAAIGATDRNVRLVLVANGAVVGIVAAVIGALVGFAAWIGYAPHLATASHHRVLWTHVPWWLLATVMLLAVLTATLAARRPARAAARVSTVAALSGRPPQPKPTHRSAVPGLVLLAVGLVQLWFSGGWGATSQRENLFKLGGLLCISVGLLLLAPAGISLLSAFAARTPMPMRLALRDLARYRARSGAALAAVSFAVLIAMVTSLLATARYADPVDYFGPNLTASELVVYPPGTGPGAGKRGPDAGAPTPDPAQLQAAVDTIAGTVGSDDPLALESTDASLGRVIDLGVLVYPGALYVATPALLRHYGIDPGSIDPAALVITSRPGLGRAANLRLMTARGPEHPGCTPPLCVGNPRIQTVRGLPSETSAPNLLLTAHGMDVLNVAATPAGWLIQAPRALNAGQINAARQAATGAGMTIETRSQAPSLDQLRNYATGAGILLALAVLAMTVGLIRSETAGDLRILAASGASSRTRRAITAATAGTLGLIGAVLGTAVAYLTVVAVFRSQLSERMSQPPWLDLVLVLVGLPVIATIVSWLVAGREPPLTARQPIG